MACGAIDILVCYLGAHAEGADVLHCRGLELRLPGLEVRTEHVATVLLRARGGERQLVAQFPVFRLGETRTDC